MEGFAFGLIAFVAVMFFFCLCCRICVIMQENDVPTRHRRPQRRGHDHMLVSVIPAGSRDGWSTPPTFDTSFWGPLPPPYSPPEEFSATDTSSPNTGQESTSAPDNLSSQVPAQYDVPSFYFQPGSYTPAEIASRLNAASPPPYEPPPSYV